MRIAIWGAGKMGQAHGDAYRKMDGRVEIKYVIESDREKAQAFARDFGCIAMESITGLEKGGIDAIDICLPTYLHREAITQALKLCGAIFCEKPVCLDREEYQCLKAVAKDGQGFVMVGQVLRFWNGYVKAKELLDEGAVGKPRMIHCFRRQKMPGWSKGNWLMDSQRSGGLLMDLCIHDVDFLCWVLGRPRTAACEIVEKDGLTLHGILTLSYEGCCASVVGSWGMPEGFHGGEMETVLEITGDQGMIVYQGGEVLELVKGDKKEQVGLPAEDGYEKELEYFVDCVENHSYPEHSDLFSVEGTMEVLWSADQAWRSKQVLPIGPEAAKH